MVDKVLLALDIAKFGVEVSEKAYECIWEATGMSQKPYQHAFEFDTTMDKWERNLQDGD